MPETEQLAKKLTKVVEDLDDLKRVGFGDEAYVEAMIEGDDGNQDSSTETEDSDDDDPKPTTSKQKTNDDDDDPQPKPKKGKKVTLKKKADIVDIE